MDGQDNNFESVKTFRPAHRAKIRSLDFQSISNYMISMSVKYLREFIRKRGIRKC